MCPERCLALDERQIVELVNPEACTGCRVCEWLCPDFAIAVHVHAQTVPSENGGLPENVNTGNVNTGSTAEATA
jgi:MinD superfamily P-loop ATPase